MKALKILHLLTYVVFASQIVAQNTPEHDWFDLAENTETPEIGNQVTKVIPGNFAAQNDFQIEDIISHFNNTYLTPTKNLPKDPYTARKYRPSTGETVTLQVPGNKMGFFFTPIFRPWLPFIREEIGKRGPWDGALVSLMEDLYTNNIVNRSSWNEIIAQGYPEDDALYDLINLTMDWKSGLSIQPHHFFTRWESELSPMPDTVFHLLEKMAQAVNDQKLWHDLEQLNRNHIDLDDSALAHQLARKKDTKNLNGDALLDYVKSIRGPTIHKNAIIIEKHFGLKKFYTKEVKFIQNGYYKYMRMLPKKRAPHSHFKISFRVVGEPVITNTNAIVSIRTEDYNRKTKQKGRSYAGIFLMRDLYDCHVNVDTPLCSTLRNVAPLENFPFRDDKQATSLKNAKEITLEIITLGDDSIFFFNGQQIANVPNKPSKDDTQFCLAITGVSLVLEEFNIWALNPNK